MSDGAETATVKAGAGTVTETTGTSVGTTADASGDLEGIIKHRIARAMKQSTPELLQRGERQLAEKLGFDLDSIDEIKEYLAKRAENATESTKLRKQLEREAQEKHQAVATATAATAQLHERLKTDAILEAVGDTKIVPKAIRQIAQLVGSRLRIDDGRAVVLDDVGEVSKVSVKKFVADFLAENDHFLASSTKIGGAGSRPSVPGVADRGKLTKEERRAAFAATLAGG